MLLGISSFISKFTSKKLSLFIFNYACEGRCPQWPELDSLGLEFPPSAGAGN